MNELVAIDLPALTTEEMAHMNSVESNIREIEKEKPADVPTEHFIHAGCYVRTCLVKAGVAISGAVIKVPTVVIVQGDCYVSVGKTGKRISGYHVFKGSAMRKQAFVGISDTYITMVYSTTKKTVEECEEEFTTQYEELVTRRKK